MGFGTPETLDNHHSYMYEAEVVRASPRRFAGSVLILLRDSARTE